MTATTESNGHSPTTSLNDLDEFGACMPFGDRHTQVIHPSVAAAILRMLKERQPATFGAYLVEAQTGYRAETRKRKPRPARVADEHQRDYEHDADEHETAEGA